MTDASTADSSTAAPAKRRVRRPHGGALRLRTLDHYDRRTNAYKRIVEKINAIEAALPGNPNVIQHQHVVNAAILGSMIEDAATKWLRGEQIDQAEFALLTNAQRRMLAAVR